MGLTTVAKRAAVPSVLVLSVFMFPSIVEVPRQVVETTHELLASGTPVRQWHQERAGEEVLPPAAREAIHLLRKNRIETFQMSRGILEHADPSVPQRLVEGAYPIGARMASPYRLLTRKELPLPACTVIDQLEDIVLARCS